MRSAGVDLNVRKNAAVLVLCLLHDIGAYKTDEIDRMMEFESQTVWEHSIYGALYLKRLSPLSGGAEGVLYHHVGFKRLQEAGIEGKSLRLADIIHLEMCIRDRGTYAFFFYQSIFLVQMAAESKALSTALRLPLQYVYASCLVGFGLGTLRQIQNIILSMIHGPEEKKGRGEAETKEEGE